ncbi:MULTISPECIES: bactofilin family protein [Shewanella]|uniref:Polymer-forming cytoskeletal protein n=1 Tax=Shewanella metallivivens TaxID=2872342 RepID=A0ABT5TPF6_9GAMM|nr:polymer-forming cytoskeletal protein [Shewanella metallivivens]
MNNNNKGITYIGADMSLEGDMTIQGPAMIAGKTVGTISSSSQINIAVGGEVEGEVYCQEMRVSGVFKGKLHCNKLIIVSSGVVDGEVSSHQMEIYDGGQFIGMRSKGPDESVLPQATSSTVNMPMMHDSQTKTPLRKLTYAAVAAAVIIGGVLLQPTISSVLKSDQEQPLQASVNADVSESDIAKNATLLLQDVDQQSVFVEQQEELISAGQSDINTAMEDLQALEQTSQDLGDTLHSDDQHFEDSEAELSLPTTSNKP